MNRERAYQTFLESEDKNSCFDITIDGIYVWELIRFKVFRQIEAKIDISTKGGQTTTSNDQQSIFKRYFQYINGISKNILFNNPFYCSQKEFVFYGSGRRFLHEDGKYWNIYCDPIINTLTNSNMLLEKPYHFDHMKPAKTKNLYHNDLIAYSRGIAEKLQLDNFRLQKSDEKLMKQIQDDFNNEFGVNLDIVSETESTLKSMKIKVPLYEKLLNRIKPKAVILSWANDYLACAAKNLGIPAIRLQKGHRHKYRVRYNYPDDYKAKHSIGTHVLLWGEWYKQNINYPLPDENLIPVGFPYLEYQKKVYENSPSRKQILFIAGPYDTKHLSQMAVNLDKELQEYEIVFRLHPSDKNTWKQDYDKLHKSGIEVQNYDEEPLHKMFSESHIQIGINSSAIIEGLYFELETYILDSSDITNTMDFLIHNNYATRIQSHKDLIIRLYEQNPPELKDLSFILESNPISKSIEAIESIAEESSYNSEAL